MNPIFLIPSSTLPSEGFDPLPLSTSKSEQSVLSMFRRLGRLLLPSQPVQSMEFTLLRPSDSDAAGMVAFPFSLGMDGGFASLDGLDEALQAWLDPLGLSAVAFGRTAGAGTQPVFSGILICPTALLEELHDIEATLAADGWRLVFPGGEVEGHGLKEIAFAGLLGLSLLGGGTSFATAVSGTPLRTEQIDSLSGSLYRTDETILAEAGKPGAKVTFVVDLSAQRGYLLVNDRVAVETRVCTGRAGKRTPTGTFRIGEKVRTGKISTIYKVALPYWMRLTDNGIGLHVGDILDAPSSAGCVRLPAGIAATLFDNLPRGTEVRIEQSLSPEIQLAMNE